MGSLTISDYPAGATPLEPEDLERLIPDLSTRAELNAAEQANIALAWVWVRGNRRFQRDLVSMRGLQRLHAEMFSSVWQWAGAIRTRELNIGVAPDRIREELPKLCGDVTFWIENHTFDWPEIAVRFHHRLVWIHPFLNGNGRHARFAADLLLEYHDQTPLPWGGSSDLVEASPHRDEYLASLRAADRSDYERLLEFATSS